MVRLLRSPDVVLRGVAHIAHVSGAGLLVGSLFISLFLCGCVHEGDPLVARLDGVHEAAETTKNARTALAFANQFDDTLAADSGDFKSHPSFSKLRDDALADLDAAAKQDPASAAVLLATKASILKHLGREEEAKNTAMASLELQPNYRAFTVVAPQLRDRSTLVKMCLRVRPVVSERAELCDVLSKCGVKVTINGNNAPGDTALEIFAHESFDFPAEMTTQDRGDFVDCEYRSRRAQQPAAEQSAKEDQNHCIVSCIEFYKGCSSLPETCVGEFRDCVTACLRK